MATELSFSNDKFHGEAEYEKKFLKVLLPNGIRVTKEFWGKVTMTLQEWSSIYDDFYVECERKLCNNS